MPYVAPERRGSALRRFAAGDHGNVAMLLAFLLVPLIAGAGMAIDLGRSAQAATLAQEAADAALLRVARAKSQDPDMTDAEMTTLARRIFDSAMAASPWIEIADFNLDFDDVEGEFNLTVGGAVDTSLMKVAGVASLPVETVSEVGLGDPPYMEIVMALDNTGSMNDNGKIADLRDSAAELVEAVFSDPQADVKVGLVPFAQYANVGVANAGQSWMQPTGAGWEGCVGSRPYPLNLTDGGYGAAQIPGIDGPVCSDPILPLTNNKTAALNAISGMDADGWTYIPAGLVWGWRVLSSPAPFTGGIPYADMEARGALKILVLLTDGYNTKAPDYPAHESADTGLADTLMMELCANIKADGIIIYSIAFDLSDPTIRGLLEDCASSPANYFDPDTDSELAAAFAEIASSLRSLSLTK